jgi:hypothetical protein
MSRSPDYRISGESKQALSEDSNHSLAVPKSIGALAVVAHVMPQERRYDRCLISPFQAHKNTM